jgi:hypothetical protein
VNGCSNGSFLFCSHTWGVAAYHWNGASSPKTANDGWFIANRLQGTAATPMILAQGSPSLIFKTATNHDLSMVKRASRCSRRIVLI